ncbi:unnamed protein product [Cladocopium goreaui]|uniref:Uncharacterized protein n=1 Tax=Cladocopium goreaui TaxID=2562237 RepID=A0A9P1FY35_9DINO|nr:unnamed protein product [Cladocopium goreaui]
MAMDCPELKKPKGIHFERFRVIGGKELAAKVPGWAFGRSCAKMLNAFLKEKDKSDLREKLEEARDAVKAIEGRLCKAKDKKKGKKLREGREEKRKKKDKGRRRHSPTSSGEKDKVKKKEKHRTGSARDKKREKDGEEPPRKGKKKRRSSSRRSTSSDSDGDALFGGKGREDVGGDRDRGPCGGGEVVKFRDTTDSESESFRDAPTDRKVCDEQAGTPSLENVAQNAAGGVSQGSVGADPAQVGLTPQAQAADLLSQRVKALEKATVDSHWGSAQFLELLSPETADPLERDEEVFTNREWLLEMKLKNMSSGRSKRKEIRKETAKKAERKGKKKAKERALRRRSQKRCFRKMGRPPSEEMTFYQSIRKRTDVAASIFPALWAPQSRVSEEVLRTVGGCRYTISVLTYLRDNPLVRAAEASSVMAALIRAGVQAGGNGRPEPGPTSCDEDTRWDDMRRQELTKLLDNDQARSPGEKSRCVAAGGTAAYEAVRKMTKLAALERKADALLPVGGGEGQQSTLICMLL